jgi:hypothetical protein
MSSPVRKMILGQTLHVASAGMPLIRSVIKMRGLLVSTSLEPFRLLPLDEQPKQAGHGTDFETRLFSPYRCNVMIIPGLNCVRRAPSRAPLGVISSVCARWVILSIETLTGNTIFRRGDLPLLSISCVNYPSSSHHHKVTSVIRRRLSWPTTDAQTKRHSIKPAKYRTLPSIGLLTIPCKTRLRRLTPVVSSKVADSESTLDFTNPGQQSTGSYEYREIAKSVTNFVTTVPKTRNSKLKVQITSLCHEVYFEAPSINIDARRSAIPTS